LVSGSTSTRGGRRRRYAKPLNADREREREREEKLTITQDSQTLQVPGLAIENTNREIGWW